MTHLSVTPQHDVPDWIRRARQGVDWGSVLVLIFCLIAANRFILQPNLPLTTSGESLLFRTADMITSFREGRLYPRWSPHAVHGYGAPIPNYEPPGVPWTAAAIALIANTDETNAARVLWVLAFVVSGLTLYALVSRRVHAVAGLMAAGLYLFSPYISLTLPHITGDLSEMMGLTLVIVHLWAVNRFDALNTPWDAVGVVLSGAALILTSSLHAGIALVTGIPLMLRPPVQRNMGRFIQMWGLSLLVSAFYWLPALLEQEDIRWMAPLFSPRQTTVSVVQLLRGGALFDPAELLPLPQLGLGSAILMACVLSGAALFFRQWRWQERITTPVYREPSPIRFQLNYFILGIAGSLWVLLPQTPAWCVGGITLCFAMGSTLSLHLSDQRSARWQRTTLAAAVFLLLLTALPALFATRPALVVNTSPAAQVQFEEQDLGIATVPPGAAIPTTLTDSFLATDLFVTGYETDTINRFSNDPRDRNRASIVYDGAERHVFQIWNRNETFITTQIAAFAGWSAALDGTPLPTSRDPETGLLQIRLPPAEGQTLTISLESTPVRTWSWIITALGLTVLTGWVMWRVRHDKIRAFQALTYLSMAETRIAAFVMALTVGAALVGYQGVGEISLRPQGWYAIRDSIFLSSLSSSGFELLAYRIEGTTFTGGESIPLTLYWRATQPLNTSFAVELTLRSVTSGATVVTVPIHAPASYPTRRWMRGMYMREDSEIELPAQIPAGRYVIGAKVYPCDRTCRPEAAMTFFDTSGQAGGTLLTLPQVLEIRS